MDEGNGVANLSVLKRTEPSRLRGWIARDPGPDGLDDQDVCETGDRAGTITDDVKRVIGRAPRRFADYVRDTTGLGVWNADVASAVS